MKNWLIPLVLLLAASFASPKDQEKRHDEVKSVVLDSGSFGIYANGKRTATEKFSIVQQAGEGVLTATLATEDGSKEQSCEMRVGADGSLRLYKWRSTLPTQEESNVEPKGQLLIEHLTSADGKKLDVPYVLPLSTVILGKFSSQLELLIWRYFASGCRRQDAKLDCGPAHFGVFVPHQTHEVGSLTVELVGRDTITVRGVQKELNKVKVDFGVPWLIWVDDQYKVIKVYVQSRNLEASAEVLRD